MPVWDDRGGEEGTREIIFLLNEFGLRPSNEPLRQDKNAPTKKHGRQRGETRGAELIGSQKGKTVFFYIICAAAMHGLYLSK